MLQSGWSIFRREDPKELVRKWKGTLRTEIRRIDREMNSLLLEQKKAKSLIKEAAKRGDMASAKLLAKEVVRLRGAVARMAGNKASMLALSNQMTETLALSKAAGTIKASTSVMTSMNNLTKVPQLQKTIKDMAKEMERSGYIQEMVVDAIDMAVDNEGIEEEADSAVDAVLQEITGETLSALHPVPKTGIAQGGKNQQGVPEEQRDELMERLAGLRAS